MAGVMDQEGSKGAFKWLVFKWLAFKWLVATLAYEVQGVTLGSEW